MSHRPIHVYKASAGSGKTFALSAEFIANLINDYEQGNHPHHHQLAITFTKKATAEMKERILQSLYDLWKKTEETDGFFQAVRAQVSGQLTDKVLRVRAGQALQEILHGYEHFHVTTIDSFFQRLLTHLAHELGLASSFKVDLGDGKVLSKAVDALMQSLTDDSEVLEWITRFVDHQLDEGKSWNVAGKLKQLSGELLKEPYLKYGELLRELPLNNAKVQDYRQSLFAWNYQKLGLLQGAAKETKEFVEQTLGFLQISNGKNYLSRLEKQMGEELPQKRSDTLDGILAGTKSLLKKSDEAKGNLREWAEEVRKRLVRVEKYYDEAVIASNSCKLSLQYIHSLRLLDDIDKHVRHLNQENNAFMLAHTPKLFADLVSGAESSFVFERAGTQFRHVMIDEFQDTSTLQWTNLQHLLVENIAQGNSCMLVGDVKQGIYRWRGGDWTALSQMGDSATMQVHTLDSNYRSGQQIVEFNNALFVCVAQQMSQSNACAENKEVMALSDIYKPEEVEQHYHHSGGFVRIKFFPLPSKGKVEEEEEEESLPSPEEELATQILRLEAEGVPFEKMAILVRRNQEVKAIFDYFDCHENLRRIPLVSDEAFLLSSSPAVQTIVHALRYIYRQDDGVAKAYVMAHLPVQQVERVFRQLDAWHEQRFHRLPFYDLITQIIHLFELEKQAGQSPYIYAFLDFVLVFLEDHSADLRTFLQEWEERLSSKSIPSTVVKGIRILTIHKSKGLAFHSVFVPYCNWTIEKDKRDDLLWVNPRQSPCDGLPLLPICCTSAAVNSIYSEDYEEEHRNRRIENLNLLYVAFTRARQNLIVGAVEVDKDKTMYNLLRDALCEENGNLQDAWKGKLSLPPNCGSEEGQNWIEWGAPSILECVSPKQKSESCYHNPLVIEAKTEDVGFQLYNHRVKFRQSHKARALWTSLDEEGSDETFNLEQYRARRIGVVLHSLMERIERIDQVEKVVREAQIEGELAESLPIEEVLTRLKTALLHPLAQKWFDGSWRLYRECSILQRDAMEGLQQYRPDRVMMRGEEVVVVDYKFGRPRPVYHQQVRDYCRLLGQMGYKGLRGYIWYVYADEIEEVVL